MSFDVSQVKALVFDVFGTVVDWRGSITREGEALAARRACALPPLGRIVVNREKELPDGRVVILKLRQNGVIVISLILT